MKTITKKKLALKIARKKGINPQEVQKTIQEFLDSVTKSLVEGNRFEFRGFGVFEIVRREKKIGRNPKAPETSVVIPARNAVKFTPGRKLKELVSGEKLPSS